jgi:hypothetical protein
MKHEKSALILAAVLGFSGCAAVTPYDIADSSQGPLYRYSLEGVEEALPLSPERIAGSYAVRMEMVPGAPKAQDQVRISFLLEDRSSAQAKPVAGAKVSCKAGMLRVAGHMHDLGVHADHPETAPGRYEMPPMAFGMGGRWDIVFQAMLPDGRQFYGVYPVMVEGPPWPQSARPGVPAKTWGKIYGKP